MVRHDAEHAVEDARGGGGRCPYLYSWHGTGPGPRFQYVGTLRWFMSKKMGFYIYKLTVRPVRYYPLLSYAFFSECGNGQ